MEYWKVLLQQQKKRGRRGFTIPFLIGSQKYLPTKTEHQTIKQFMLDVVTNSSFETCVKYCLDTNELIIEIRNPNIPVVYPMYNGYAQTNFSVSILNNNLGDNVEEIIQTFVARYQSLINRELHSLRERFTEREIRWDDFTDDEKLFIQNCFEGI